MPPPSVPFHDPSRAAVADEPGFVDALQRVIASKRYVLGPEVSSFEAEFAEFVPGRSVVGVASGTDALAIALRTVGVRAGDEVITVANAGGYTATACFAIGARPRWVDVKTDDLLIDPSGVAALVNARTRAVVVTHLYGQVADVAAVRDACGDIPVVEDCAQAHGAVDARGGVAGALGDAAAYSFYPTKNLGAFGDGGAVAVGSERVDVVRELRMYGWNPKYVVQRYGGENSRLDELQAAFLRLRLGRLAQDNQRRREIAEAYRAAAPERRFVADPATSVNHLCVLWSEDRDADRQRLADLGVATDVHFPVPDHRQPAWCDSSVDLPATELACRSVLSLPCFPELTDAEVAQVADALQAM